MLSNLHQPVPSNLLPLPAISNAVIPSRDHHPHHRGPRGVRRTHPVRPCASPRILPSHRSGDFHRGDVVVDDERRPLRRKPPTCPSKCCDPNKQQRDDESGHRSSAHCDDVSNLEFFTGQRDEQQRICRSPARPHREEVWRVRGTKCHKARGARPWSTMELLPDRKPPRGCDSFRAWWRPQPPPVRQCTYLLQFSHRSDRERSERAVLVTGSNSWRWHPRVQVFSWSAILRPQC